MIADDLNLKTEIKINNKMLLFEIITIIDKEIIKIQLDQAIFIKEKEVEDKELEIPQLSLTEANEIEEIPDEKPIVATEKPEQKQRKDWTEQEDEILKASYKTNTISKIIKKNLLPGRSNKSIQQRVNRLNIKKYKKTKNKKNIVNPNFNNKKLAKYSQNVYEQCMNHLIFKLEDYPTFTKEDIFKLLKDWYKQNLFRDIVKTSKSTQYNYVYSYLRCGIESGSFHKIDKNQYELKKEDPPKPTIEPSEKPNIPIVSSDNEPVRGFAEHKAKRIAELHEREKLYKKKGTKNETID